MSVRVFVLLLGFLLVPAWSWAGEKKSALAERITALCRDKAHYQRIAKACRAHVATNYSPERIDALIRTACGLEQAAG